MMLSVDDVYDRETFAGFFCSNSWCRCRTLSRPRHWRIWQSTKVCFNQIASL